MPKYTLYNWCIDNGDDGECILNDWTGLDACNNLVNMHNVAKGSTLRVKWKCHICGNEWITSINSRTYSKSKCNKCRVVNKKNNSLNKWIADNGEYGIQIKNELICLDENNNPFECDFIPYTSNSKVHWKCSKCGNEWIAPLRNRTTGNRTGCPLCANKRQIKTGINDLYTWCKQNGSIGDTLLKQWLGRDKDDNVVDIHSIARSTAIKYKWKCSSCGNIWLASPHDRTIVETGCPLCSHIRKGVNDIYTWCKRNGKYGEQIIEEFVGKDEYNKDIDIHSFAYGSVQKVLWKCNICGREWLASPNNRLDKRTGCPFCNKTGTSYSEQFIFKALGQVFNKIQNRYKTPTKERLEFDIAIKLEFKGYNAVFIEYSPEYWHLGREYITDKKVRLCKEHNIYFIQIVDSIEKDIEIEYSPTYIYGSIEGDFVTKRKNLENIIKYILNTLNVEPSLVSNIDFDRASDEAYKETHEG